MKRRAHHALVVVALAMLGCGESDSSDGGGAGASGTGGGNAGGAGGAGGAGPTGPTDVTKLTLDHEPVAFDQPTTAHVTLWGFDSELADASASAVARYAIEVRTLPVELELDIPDDPHGRIDQGNGSVSRDRAGFYFSVTIDVGRDERVCEADFVQDYQRTVPSPFRGWPPAAYTIVVKEFGGACEPLDR